MNKSVSTVLAVKFSPVVDTLDERGLPLWAAAESHAIGCGGDALVSDATGLSRDTIRVGRQPIHSGIAVGDAPARMSPSRLAGPTTSVSWRFESAMGIATKRRLEIANEYDCRGALEKSCG